MLPLEYPYGGGVGSEGWGPNSPSGALSPYGCYKLGLLRETPGRKSGLKVFRRFGFP